jgi:hypothetical protein
MRFMYTEGLARALRTTLRFLLAGIIQGFVLVSVTASTSAPATSTSSSTTLTVDKRLLVNGIPTFFIGTAPGPPVDLRTPEGRDGWAELAEGGITVVRSVVPLDSDDPTSLGEVLAYMDNAWEHGVRVWPALRKVVTRNSEEDRAKLKKVVSSLKGHPGLLFWKSSDEPEWSKTPVEPLRKAYETIRAEDPNHLVWITHAPRGTHETLLPYNVACDVIATDIYPVSEPRGKHSLLPNKDLSMVGDYTQRMVRLSGGEKMVFMILQGCWSGVLPSRDSRNRLMFPTFREERYMLYQAIINGSDSISFFGLTFGLSGRDEELGFNWTFWRAVLRPLLAEIREGSELYPVLTGPRSNYPLRFTGAPQIEVRWKEAGVYLYIFAAAREGGTRTVTFSGIADGEVSVLFENRTVTATGGQFVDRFRPHDVHVYRALRKDPAVQAAP